MAAFDVLRQYLADRATYTNDDFAFIERVFLPRRLPADDFLQRAGEVATYAAAKDQRIVNALTSTAEEKCRRR